MNYFAAKVVELTFLLLACVSVAPAQTDTEKFANRYSCSNEDEKAVRDYFANLAEQQTMIAEVEREAREYQINTYGRIRRKIAGGCEWSNDACPISLVKPYYSREAVKYRIFGQIKAETIVDENGKVISVRIRGGKPFLNQAARAAACSSRFSPKMYGDKIVKFTRTIVYNFTLN